MGEFVRLMLKGLLLAVALFIAGFFVFVATLPQVNPEGRAQADLDSLPVSDVGIVAFTGGGGKRIVRGMDLLEQGMGERLLISGTHPDVRKADLHAYGSADLLDCCVDLGDKALTTIGNGIETRDWAEANGYRGVYVVTTDYHLRRALVEVREAAPSLTVIGVPVRSEAVPAQGWMGSPRAWQILGWEYTKYLLSVVRSVF